jgi:hypothetical protein
MLQTRCTMRRLLAFALVLLPALPALAGARTLALSTVITNGATKLHAGETSITVRAPKGTKVSQSVGASSLYVPIAGKLNAAKTKILFKVEVGKYYASPSSALFSIKH